MTVKEAIALLKKMPDHNLEMMVDCPYCGSGNQLASIEECVVLRTQPEPQEKP